jgi:hypothetical protein
MATDEAELNICEQITRMDRVIAETAKYLVERRELGAPRRSRLLAALIDGGL